MRHAFTERGNRFTRRRRASERDDDTRPDEHIAALELQGLGILEVEPAGAVQPQFGLPGGVGEATNFCS